MTVLLQHDIYFNSINMVKEEACIRNVFLIEVYISPQSYIVQGSSSSGTESVTFCVLLVFTRGRGGEMTSDQVT